MRHISTEEKERRIAEDVWLQYLNKYLYEAGTISLSEYKIMTEKIAQRKQKSGTTKA